MVESDQKNYQDIAKWPKSPFKGTPSGQIMDNLSNKIMIAM